MPLAALFRRNRHRDQARKAYERIVAAARRPEFFLVLGVPDTLDGRFEVLALHAFLALNRLKAERPSSADFAQQLFDTMFADLDRGLREMGASDLGVGRHVKQMAKAFYGRIVAYEHGLAGSEADLAEALRRNLFGTVTPSSEALAEMTRYVQLQARALAGQTRESLLAGDIIFHQQAIENERI